MKIFDFCFHKYNNLKIGKFPLIARYCTKCGKIESGNVIYYDGSVYQIVYKNNLAINFLEIMKQRVISRTELTECCAINYNIIFEDSEDNYETIEKYEEIIKLLA